MADSKDATTGQNVRNGSGVVASSIDSFASVTPHDSNANEYDAIYVGTTGNIAVQLEGMSSSVVVTNVPVGYHPWRTSLILSTGTTASGILGIKYSV